MIPNNQKGYMLVEIILASVIAFSVAAFIINLTIKLKNKNDDSFVESVVATDQAIITNKLMEYAKVEKKNFDCGENVLRFEGKTLKYKNDVIDIFNEYANPSIVDCSTDGGEVYVNIKVDVEQMPDKDFDIKVNYKYEIGDNIPPTLTFGISGTDTATWKCVDNEGGSGIAGDANGTEPLTGTSDIKIEKTCTDNAGNSTTDNHTYKYSSCATGSNTCKSGKVRGAWWYDYSCRPTAEIDCDVCSGIGCDCNCSGVFCHCTVYHVENSSCATGSNTCKGGFKF